MLIHSIHPRNYRNLAHQKLEFSPHANFISGRNGQGKTNLLETIHWLLTLRSKRGTAADCVTKGETGFQIDSDLTFADIRHSVSLRIEGRSRRLLIDGTPPKRRRDYLQNVLVVDFFPEDLLILIMEPALRRRFIDLACVQYYLPHEEVLRRYKRLMEQRNSLLKTPGGPDIAVLDSYDAPLTESASAIVTSRLVMLAKLGARTDSIFREGIGEKYKAALHYIPSLDGIPDAVNPEEGIDPDQFNGIYLDAFRNNRSRDIESGRTSVGPHRDDWGMTLDGKTVRSFASRGEVRSAMFALHLARFHVLTEKRGIEPVVLIDDVMSELDSERRTRVLELLPPGQIFLTSCDPPPEIGNLISGELVHFEMNSGTATLL